MRKSQEVIGLSIIHLQTGKMIGTVCDLLFDHSQRWRGILLEYGGWLKKRKYIPSDLVTSIGKDAVIVENDVHTHSLDQRAEKWIGVLYGHQHLKGRRILLSTGVEVGSIQNVYFLEKLGTLVGYEISDGLFNDLRVGRKLLKSKEPLIWGEDVCVAPVDQVEIKDA